MTRPSFETRRFRLLMAFGLLLGMPGLASCADAGAIEEWPVFERRVRDGEIGPTEGRAEIARWAGVLEAAYPAEGFDRLLRPDQYESDLCLSC